MVAPSASPVAHPSVPEGCYQWPWTPSDLLNETYEQLCNSVPSFTRRGTQNYFGDVYVLLNAVVMVLFAWYLFLCVLRICCRARLYCKDVASCCCTQYNGTFCQPSTSAGNWEFVCVALAFIKVVAVSVMYYPPFWNGTSACGLWSWELSQLLLTSVRSLFLVMLCVWMTAELRQILPHQDCVCRCRCVRARSKSKRRSVGKRSSRHSRSYGAGSAARGLLSNSSRCKPASAWSATQSHRRTGPASLPPATAVRAVTASGSSHTYGEGSSYGSLTGDDTNTNTTSTTSSSSSNMIGGDGGSGSGMAGHVHANSDDVVAAGDSKSVHVAQRVGVAGEPGVAGLSSALLGSRRGVDYFAATLAAPPGAKRLAQSVGDFSEDSDTNDDDDDDDDDDDQSSTGGVTTATVGAFEQYHGPGSLAVRSQLVLRDKSAWGTLVALGVLATFFLDLGVFVFAAMQPFPCEFDLPHAHTEFLFSNPCQFIGVAHLVLRLIMAVMMLALGRRLELDILPQQLSGLARSILVFGLSELGWFITVRCRKVSCVSSV